MRIPVFRGAIVTVLLAGAMVGQSLTAAPAAAAGLPDLTVAISATPNPVDAGETLTYTMQVSNSSTEQCRKAYPEPICIVSGRAVNGVAANLTIPAGAHFQSSSPDHGFACKLDTSGVNLACTGGNLGMDDTATIQVLMTPTTSGTLSATATVDPANVVAERSETNNAATVSTSVSPGHLPDLVITSFGGTTAARPGGQATFTATISNVGPGPANNVELGFASGSYDWTLVSSSGAGALTPCQTGFSEFMLVVSCPASGHIASLAPGQSATVTVVVQIPAGTPAGTYYTVAAADDYNQLKETNQYHNLGPRFATQVF